MKLIKNLTPTKILEYRHYIKFDNKEYLREEIVKHYHWKPISFGIKEFHTIKWILFDNGDEKMIEYFNYDDGWTKNMHLDKLNHVPEIEKIFKETIDKDV